MTNRYHSNIKSFQELLSSFRNSDKQIALCTSDQKISISYHQLFKKINIFAEILSKQISRGERVMIANMEGPYWVVAFFACLLNKVIAVPIDRRMSKEIQVEIVKLVGAKKVITVDRNLELGKIKKIIYDQNVESKTDWKPKQINPNTAAEVMFTSGTWGKPKGVVLTHGNLISNLNSILKVYKPKKGEKTLSVLPLSHAYEQMAGLLVPLASGCQIIYQQELDRASLLASMKTFKVNYMVVVPKFLEVLEQKILDNVGNKKIVFNLLILASKPLSQKNKAKIFRQFHKHLGGNLHTFIVGGAPLNERTDKFFRNLGFNNYVGYGLTETSPVLAVSIEKNRPNNSVGRPIPGVKIKISADGEILASGPNITPGYWSKIKSTKPRLFPTGDLGYFDKKGRLIITGRKKNLALFSTGDKIQLEDIENIANDFPKVAESCAVYKEYDGLNVLGLFYVGSCSEQDLKNYLNQKLPFFARLAYVDKWPDKVLPRSHTLKLRRDLIQEYFKNERPTL